MKFISRKYKKISIALSLALLLPLIWSLTACSTTPESDDAFGSTLSKETLAMFRKSPNFRDENFINIAGEKSKPSTNFLGAFYRYFTTKNPAPQPEKPLPFVALNNQSFIDAPKDSYRVTWLGHSAILIEIDGLKILTDPMFGERASPFSWIGPKRFQQPPINIADIPELDAIIISHDHYDHLDMESIKLLNDRTLHFFTPLGVGSHLKQWGVNPSKITELDWWGEAEVANGVIVAATPAQHFSGRGVFDRNKTQWASWAIIGQKERLFFSGDTGFHREFDEIGKRYGPFDLAMLENGAYDKSWSQVHMMPEETIAASKMLNAKRIIPIHWGTFDLALHPWYEPAQKTYSLSRAHGVTAVQPKMGEFVLSTPTGPVAQWWNDQRERVEETNTFPKAALATKLE
ncbi:MAG: MBL fold metallo-hydrolase [Rhodospirillales bacterium]|nr:MBL fold metallo-hydrolase [Rhodospirillales bacterium]